MTLLTCDVIYTRYEGKMKKSMHLNKFPYNVFLKNAVIVWEFNALPNYALVKGKDENEVNRQKRLLRAEAGISDLAVCVSETMADYVEKQLHWRKVLVVPNGSNPDHFKPGLPFPERMNYFKEKFNVAWMGSLSHEWSHTDLLLSTAKVLWNQGNQDIAFHLFGKFPQTLSQYIPPNVHLYGNQPYHKLPNWLSAMDVGVILYKDNLNNYGSPIKLFDYMANGLAIISTEHPQVKQILAEIDFDHFVMQSESEIELSEKIMSLAKNHQLLIDFKKKTRELVVYKYNWKITISELLKELELMVHENNKSNKIK